MLQQLRLENFKGFAGPHTIDLAPITLVFGQNSAGKSALLHSLLLLRQSLDTNQFSEESADALTFQGAGVDLGSYEACVNQHDNNLRIRIGLTYEVKVPRFEEETVLTDEQVQSDDFCFYSANGRTVVESVQYRIEGSPDRDGHFEAHDHGPWLRFDPTIPSNAKILKELSETFEEDESSFRDFCAYIGDLRYSNRAFLPMGIRRNDREVENPRSEVWSREQSLWQNTLRRRGNSLRDRMIRLDHLGGIREIPSRISFAVPGAKGRLGVRGERVVDLLLADSNSTAAANRWLSKLGVPYSVEAVPLTQESMPQLGTARALLLRDMRSGVAVTALDVGVGISQVLPVVVLTATARNRVLLIEQPELHLHPALQSELGDLFIESQESRKNQIIVETHSEHLLLRLQRRIREGTLDSDRVKVLYVTADETGSHILELRLDANGDFLDSWPNGFFDERLREML